MERIILPKGEYLLYGFEQEGLHIIPPHGQPKRFRGDTLLWLLPANQQGQSRQYRCGQYSVKTTRRETVVTFDSAPEERAFPPLPCCDFFGNEMTFDLPEKAVFETTFAQFYWGSLLNQIAERTVLRKKKDIREGYVLSTLDKTAYAGTYPAVDHEFHMKGRFAVGGKAEAALIRRMLLLQLKVMREDKQKLYRNVCAIQPNRRREYNVWRLSKSLKVKAQMFRITANIEFVEGVYNYYALTKDRTFISDHIDDLEKNCAYIERFLTPDGFLDSHVHFEDQVIKNFAVLQSQLFAANAMRLMGALETLLGRTKQAARYQTLAQRLGQKAVLPFPDGFWDDTQKRFIDWIDKDGVKHDHVHLLANELPVLFGFASKEQADGCRAAIEENRAVFDLFPSFVAAKVEDYTLDEIGVGGPYDLCAAGRYWCWDAMFLASQENGAGLLRQLLQVCAQAQTDRYQMGERYDMNHVYYNTGADAARNWHGAKQYYEYPNVWIYIFVCLYLGVRRGFDCALELSPLFRNGSVTLAQYGVAFTVTEGKVTEIRNLGDKPLTVLLPRENRTVTV